MQNFLFLFFAFSCANALYGTQRVISVNDGVIHLEGATKSAVIKGINGTTLEVIIKDSDQWAVVLLIDNDTLIEKTYSVSGFKERAEVKNVTNDNLQFQELMKIFKKYQGLTGEWSFYKLERDVKKSVKENRLHGYFMKMLRSFEVQPIDLTVSLDKVLTPQHVIAEKEKTEENNLEGISTMEPNIN